MNVNSPHSFQVVVLFAALSQGLDCFLFSSDSAALWKQEEERSISTEEINSNSHNFILNLGAGTSYYYDERCALHSNVV